MPPWFALQTSRSSVRIFPVKYISAWSSTKIKESYILQLVFLKCFLPTLARDISKQEGLNNFFLMTGDVMSHLSKCGDIHIHAWIFAPKAEITLQFLHATWLDCEAVSATRKGLKRWPETPSNFPHPLIPGRHQCIHRQPPPACRTRSPEMQMCNSLPKHCEQHQPKAAAGCFNTASSAIFPLYRQVPLTQTSYSAISAASIECHISLEWTTGWNDSGCTCGHSVWTGQSLHSHSSVKSVYPET